MNATPTLDAYFSTFPPIAKRINWKINPETEAKIKQIMLNLQTYTELENNYCILLNNYCYIMFEEIRCEIIVIIKYA